MNEAMNKSDLEIFEKWMRRFRVSEDYVNPFFTEAKENYELYKSYKTSADKVYKYDIFVPYSFALMEDATAYFMLSMLAAEKLFTLRSRARGIPVAALLEWEELIEWAIMEDSAEFALEAEEAMKNANLYGNCYLTHFPVLDSENNFKSLHITAPSFFDIYPEPNRKRFSRMNHIVKKSWDDFGNLQKLAKQGIYDVVEVEKSKGGKTPDDDAIAELLTRIGYGVQDVQAGYEEKTQRIELLDCMEDGNVITIAGRKRIIRNTEKDKFKPYSFAFPILDCRLMGGPGEFFGLSLIQSFKPLQKELNLLRSQRRDNIALILNKLFIYDIMAGEVDLDTLFSGPGNVIMTTNRQALEEFPIQDVTGSSFKESQELMADIQNITNMTDYMRGQTPKRRETATTVMRLQQAAQSRLEWAIWKVDAYILRRLGKRVLIYLRENLPAHDYAKIVGMDNNYADLFYSMDVGDIERNLIVYPLTEAITRIKEIDTNQFIQAFDRLIQLPEVNRAALVKQLLLKLGQKDVREILPMLSQMGQQSVVDEQAAMGQRMSQLEEQMAAQGATAQ